MINKLSIAVFFTLLFAFVLSGGAFAIVKKTPAKMYTDSSNVKVKKFEEAAIAKFKKDKDFNYSGDAVNHEESLWTRFWNWLWDTLFGWLDNASVGGHIFKYALLSVSVAFLVYVVFKSLGIDPIKLLRGEAKKINMPYSESLENIHGINFDAEVENAVSQHNYRLAVRLLYLKSLKQLSEAGLIKWQIDKTNAAYVMELTNAEQKQAFETLTLQFEFVWYGNFSIDKQAFGNINQLFQNFKKHFQ